jgi:PAS domain S-box-containing protein
MLGESSTPSGSGSLDVLGQAASLLAEWARDGVDTPVEEALGVLGRALGADRVYIFEHQPGKRLSNTHEWCAPGIDPMIGILQDLPADDFSWSEAAFRRGEVLHLDVDELPPEAAAERATLEEQGILTLVLAPIGRGDVLRGFIGADAVRQHRDWSGEPIAVLRWIAELLDIALGQREHRRARSRAEELLRRFADQASEAIFLYDATVSRGVYANPAFETVTGVARSDWLADWRRSLTGTFSPDDLAAIDAAADLVRAGAWRSLLDERGCIFRGEQHLRVHGEDRWLFTTMFPVVGTDDEPVGFGAMSEDITERRRLVAELDHARVRAEEANRAKSRFLARVSHELLNPLHAMLGFTELLRDMEGMPREAATFVEHVDGAGRRLSATVGDLLDLSKVESGELRVVLDQVDVVGLAKEAANMMAGAADVASVSIVLDVPERCDVRSDGLRLQQILLNLVSNAVKYNRPGGSVAVVVEGHADHVAVTVADTGRGIDPERLSSVFDPFERLGAETTTTPGTGLGLAIVDATARVLGIEVGIESTPGQGTTVRLRVPVPSSGAPIEA